MKNIQKTTARPGKIVTTTGFQGYDFCLNTYVGCQFGCSFCYVRWFIKDKDKPWGEFVRRREHITKRLPKELGIIAGKRLVLGTMTDPYQPEERKYRLTRNALMIIGNAQTQPSKIGIFTRSPIVLDDIGIIEQLPRARIHYSITPLDRKTSLLVEMISVHTARRWDVVKQLKQAGIRIHVNVAPAIPIISDRLVDEFCEKLHEIGIDEFFVDPMQVYSDSFASFSQAMQNHPDWPAIHYIMSDKSRYNAWKAQFKQLWDAAWKKTNNKSTLPIWCDHEKNTWVDMRSGSQMDLKYYGDDLD